jgi:hypothetical protein
MSKYTAYLLTDESKRRLTARFKPAFPKVAADHITHRYGVEDFADMQWPEKIEVIGSIDDKNGIQALLVRIDGETRRPDGGTYHITWSYDPNRIIPPFIRDEEGPIPYEAKHSNAIIKHWEEHNKDGKLNVRMLDEPMVITAMPAHVEKRADGERVLNILPKKPGSGYKPWGAKNQNQPNAPQ